MGCVSSKLVKKELREGERRFSNGNCSNHVVSLTSSTYGVLKLDKDQEEKQQIEIKAQITETKKRSPPREEFEVINTWELMEDLEEEAIPISILDKKSPKSRVFLRGFDARSPLKFFNQMASPKKLKRSVGKENRGLYNGYNFSPKNSFRSSPNLTNSIKGAQKDVKCDNLRSDLGVLSKRRSLSPLFGTELLPTADKELKEEAEQIKKTVSETAIAKRTLDLKTCGSTLDVFEKRCPPDGENSVVIYTTTLRGIRKTFEDCNNVRSLIESHDIQIFERDVSMDSRFKEDLRGLMGTKEVKVPVVFVKGRLIGGADEVTKLEEEGKLGILFEGIPRAAATCRRCGGIRFVMCVGCNGSCKVLGEDKKTTVRCVECNENGLIQCPICC